MLTVEAPLRSCATDRFLVLQEHDPAPEIPPRVEWVLCRRSGTGVVGALPAAYVRPLLTADASLAGLPWEPVTLVPAHSTLAEVMPAALVSLLATLESSGVISGVVPPSAMLEMLYDAYRRLHAQHQVTLEATNDAITIIDESQRVLGWNAAAERLFGTRGREIVGEPIDRFFDAERLICCRVLQDGQGVWRLPHTPRAGVHTIITSVPITVEDRVVGAISVENDVTQVVRLQGLLADATSRMTYLESEVEQLRGIDDPCSRIVGRSQQRFRLIERIRKAAATSATVLIQGESGVGKELVARAIHELSDRAGKPFVVVNCGAIPAALFESELFGYEGGAFTGADKRGKAGLLEAAEGGTLFLDEVGELPHDLQVKLLRVLEERTFYRIGGTVPRSAQVRFVSATNRNLVQMIARETFRQDLFYRLRVVSIEVPPLRVRREDLPDLIDFFVNEVALRYLRKVVGIEPAVTQALLRYDWPGNIRELRNVVEQLVVMADDGVLRTEYLPPELHAGQERAVTGGDLVPVADSRAALSAPAGPDRDAVLAALQEAKGNRSAAARLLGISRPTLYSRLRQLGLHT